MILPQRREQLIRIKIISQSLKLYMNQMLKIVLLDINPQIMLTLTQHVDPHLLYTMSYGFLELRRFPVAVDLLINTGLTKIRQEKNLPSLEFLMGSE